MDRNEFKGTYYLNHLSSRLELNLQKETNTEDQQLKFKARSINLIKYNPNFFTNKKENAFTYIMGGNRSLITIGGMAALFAFYRGRANYLRQCSYREGIWLSVVYAFFGASMGTFYSLVYFWRWQLHLNDIWANYLLKRYKGADELDRTNIYQYNDVANRDECYNFSNKYFNHAHI